jgi:hypothetical protein
MIQGGAILPHAAIIITEMPELALEIFAVPEDENRDVAHHWIVAGTARLSRLGGQRDLWHKIEIRHTQLRLP